MHRLWASRRLCGYICVFFHVCLRAPSSVRLTNNVTEMLSGARDAAKASSNADALSLALLPLGQASKRVPYTRVWVVHRCAGRASGCHLRRSFETRAC